MKRPVVIFLKRKRATDIPPTPASPAPEEGSLKEPPKRGWHRLRPDVEGTFGMYGSVFRNDPVTSARGERRTQ